MSKKIYIVRGKDEDELVENLNNFDKESFATQVFQLKKGWVSFVYCNEGYTQNTQKVAQNGSKSLSEPLSEKQKLFLIKNEYKGNMNLTKAEAHALIKGFIDNQKAENI